MTDAVNQAPATPLEKCPVCNYSLRGLPSAHRCPECGFEYDEQTRVWRPRSRWKLAAVLLAAVPLLFALRHSVSEILLPPSAGWSFWLAVVKSLLFGLAFVIVIVAYRQDPRIAAAPRGLYVKFALKGSGFDIYPWDGFERIGTPSGILVGDDRRLLVRVRGRGRDLNLSCFVRGNGGAAQLAREIETARAHYLAIAPDDAPSCDPADPTPKYPA